MSVRIRSAASDDAAPLADVHVAGWRAAYRGFVPDAVLDALDVDDRREMWSGVLTKSSARVLVAERDGAVVGFSSMGAARDRNAPRGTGEITALYLLPDQWRRGVGRALFHASAAELADGGFVRIWLWVFEANARGRGFYQAMGFQSDQTVVIESRTNQPEVRYGCPIPGVGKRRFVRDPHESTFPDPITFARGDRVSVGGRDPEHPGWMRTTTSEGNEGWAPESMLEFGGSGGAIAREAYTARELTTARGEEVALLYEVSGWSWVRRGPDEGWVPTCTLSETR